MIKKTIGFAANHHRHFAKFCAVGVFTTIISYATFYFLFEAGVNYLLASAIGFVFGVFSGYPINKKWTFDFGAHHKKNHLALYFSVYVFSLILSLVFLKITVDIFHLDPRFAYVLSIGLVTCTNFIGTRFFVFKH